MNVVENEATFHSIETHERLKVWAWNSLKETGYKNKNNSKPTTNIDSRYTTVPVDDFTVKQRLLSTTKYNIYSVEKNNRSKQSFLFK